MTEKNLVKQSATGITNKEEVPEWLRKEVGHQAGMEQVEQTDVLIPRLGLCQSLSPQRRKNDPAFIESLVEGQLFNTVTKQIYGETVNLVPLFFFKNRIKFFPIADGGGIDCISVNGFDGGRIHPSGCLECQYSKWGNGFVDDEHGNDPPLCTLYHNYMAFVTEPEPSPIALSYKATGLKMSKQTLAQIRLTRLPMYAKWYKIEVVTMRDGQNEWFEKKLIPGAYVDKDMFKQMEEMFESLQAMNIKVDTTGEEGDTSFPHGKDGSIEM